MGVDVCSNKSVFLFLPVSFVSMLAEVCQYLHFEKSNADGLLWAKSIIPVPSSRNISRKFPDWCFYRTGWILSLHVKQKIILKVILKKQLIFPGKRAQRNHQWDNFILSYRKSTVRPLHKLPWAISVKKGEWWSLKSNSFDIPSGKGNFEKRRKMTMKTLLVTIV